MLEGEVEHEDSHDPTVHGGVRLDVGIVQHAFDVFCIDFDCKILQANNPNLDGLECTKQAIDLDFRL